MTTEPQSKMKIPKWEGHGGHAIVYNADAMYVLVSMPSATVSLIATDPPYYKCRSKQLCPWDHQWKTADEYLEWLGRVLDEFRRVLKPNGSLYLFASPQMAWRVEGEVRRRFNLLCNIRWRKPPFSTKAEMFVKEELRAPFPASETILFAEQYAAAEGITDAEYALNGLVYRPLKDWFRSRAIGLSGQQFNLMLGFSTTGSGKAGKIFGDKDEFQMPTAETYDRMQSAYPQFDREYEDLRREYEDLRREYEDLRREYEDLRRPFTVTADDQYTDVWDFPTVGQYPGKHECEKPAALMRQIIRASSRPGDTVLDCFAGSGVMGQVAVELGRRPILIEQDPHWYAQAIRRVEGRKPEPRRIDKPCPLFDRQEAA